MQVLLLFPLRGGKPSFFYQDSRLSSFCRFQLSGKENSQQIELYLLIVCICWHVIFFSSLPCGFLLIWEIEPALYSWDKLLTSVYYIFCILLGLPKLYQIFYNHLHEEPGLLFSLFSHLSFFLFLYLQVRIMVASQNSEDVAPISGFWIRGQIAVLFLLSVFSRKLPREITWAWSLGVSGGKSSFTHTVR